MADFSQRAVFTALPDGLAGDVARLNLHISPRLTLTGAPSAKLTDFPAWEHWADTINNAAIRVWINGSLIVCDRREKAQPDIWSALFPPHTLVRGHVFQDLRGTDVLTYPLTAVADLIEQIYVQQAGEDGDALPTVRELSKLEYLIPRERPGREALIRLLRESAESGREEGGGRQWSPHNALALLAAYHQPLDPVKKMVAKPDSPDDGRVDAMFRSVDRVPMLSEAALAAQFDFHRIVAAIGQHPALMRACGLVVPLDLRRSDLPDGDVTVAVEMQWDGGGIETESDICPRTHARHNRADFRARPRDPAVIAGGWMRLPAAGYSLVTMDVDGAGLSLKNFATNLPGMSEERFDDEVFGADKIARVGMPRIRSAGLQLAQTRRDVAIRGQFELSGALNDTAMQGHAPELFAEDVIRGWRADIADTATGRWRSLMRFDGTYHLTRSVAALETRDEETVLKLAGGKAASGAAPDLIKASEAVFTWSGWSLAAPQPGRAIMPDDRTHADAPNTVPDGLPLQVSTRAHPGSLPVLRFGHYYSARLRWADIAGGGLGWQDGPSGVAGTETEPVFFGRYEPVEAPVLTLIKGDPLPKDGESMARAALRTRDDPADSDREARRNVVPAQVGIRFAELHSVLDKDGRPDPATYSLLATRDDAYPETGVAGPAFNPSSPSAAGSVETFFAIAPEAALTPYLYDPLAGGAALRIRGVPGINPDKIWQIPFHGDTWDANAMADWPDARGFSLRAAEQGPTGWDPATRTFTVALAPAERARIELSTLVPKRGLALFKLLASLEELADSGAPSTVERFQRARTLAARGRHWMFTPWRQVELVHAVQRPLVTPGYVSVFANRTRGNVTASVHYTTLVHCKSTVRIDTDATWAEIDDTAGPGPAIARLAADAFSHPFARLDHPDGRALRLQGRHVFADTRARFVSYRMRATTRFREYMPPSVRADPDAIDVKGARQAIWVPSASPPAAPIIRYVVPTFGWWDSGAPGSEQRVWREGGGLRVYLDRPWFSSGSSEMLAVLLPEVSDIEGGSPLRDFVTQWGRDPAWAGPAVKTIAPQRTDFPRRIDQGPIPFDFGDPDNPPDVPDGAAAGDGFRLTQLVPQGAPATIQATAVPHAVAYDPLRQLWYCDIVIRPGTAYFPFIRLALARYQPHAVRGCELSSVALASFQQLSADRVAVVTPLASPGMVRVQVYGRLPAAGEAPYPRAGAVTVTLQRLKPGGDPDLDWRTTDQGLPSMRGAGDGIVVGPRRVRRGASGFHRARTSLTPQHREMLRAGVGIEKAGLAGMLKKIPDLFGLLLPPLIHDETIVLPARGADRLRLLVTETEQFLTEEDDGRTDFRDPVGRIVYASMIEV
jgi:hypothetical protein